MRFFNISHSFCFANLEISGPIFLSLHTASSFDNLVQIPNDTYSPASNGLSFDTTCILSPRVESSSHTRNILHVTYYSIKLKAKPGKAHWSNQRFTYLELLKSDQVLDEHGLELKCHSPLIAVTLICLAIWGVLCSGICIHVKQVLFILLIHMDNMNWRCKHLIQLIKSEQALLEDIQKVNTLTRRATTQ
jgi:hypothetical protein